MYGAVIGDMIGSMYEFRSMKDKGFPLFSDDSRLTDDSVMTVAVAEALLTLPKNATDEAIRDSFVAHMQDWGRRYPNAGYGGRFIYWIFSPDPQPYNSYGNGSAMRVSPIGWWWDDLETTRQMARFSAEVTHNHPEGIKGAEATAVAIFMARTGASKDEIKEYIQREFAYDLDRTCEEIRKDYTFDVSCQGSVPEAIIAFLEGKDYEDTVRNAVSLGGDADTQGAIAGSIAEAFFGIPRELLAECRQRLPEEIKKVVDRFYQ